MPFTFWTFFIGTLAIQASPASPASLAKIRFFGMPSPATLMGIGFSGY